MKLTYAALTAISCFSMGFVGGIYASGIKTPSELALDACARKHNTYACRLPPPVEE